jgi:ADP-ribose pyrophosphatase
MAEPAARIVSATPIATVGATSCNRVTAALNGTDTPKPYLLISRPPAVAVVPVDMARHRFALVRQRRIGAGGDKVLEVPAGKIDSGENPIDAARRELQEETGLRAGSIELVTKELWVSPGYTDERITLAVAARLTRTARRPEDAHIEIVWNDVDQLSNVIALAEDLKTCALLLALQRHLFTRAYARPSR